MRFSMQARQLPPRVAAGAFILNSGLGKLRADEETAAQLHGFAAGAYPVLARVKPADFVRLLAAGEITLGAALLLPVVPAAVAGAGLAAFSGGLLGLYARTPGMRWVSGSAWSSTASSTGLTRRTRACPPSRAPRRP